MRAIILCMLFAILLLGCTSQEQPPAQPPAQTPTNTTGGNQTGNTRKIVKVYLSDFKFEPADIEVSVGTRVVWVNNDPTTHTVNSDTKLFNMSLPEGEVASYVFNKTGRYAYHCAIHTSMRGSVTVR